MCYYVLGGTVLLFVAIFVLLLWGSEDVEHHSTPDPW